MWVSIGLLSVLMIIIGTINLIKPLHFMKIKNRRQAFIIWAVGFLVFTISVTNTPSTTTTITTIPNTFTAEKTPVEKPKPNLELLEARSENEGYGRYIVGTIKNNTNRQYKYVQVEINLYDSSDAQVGSTLANTNNLEPGGKWKFKAAILEDNTARFKIKDITGW